MPHALFRRLAVLAVVVFAGVMGVLPGTASAHNTLVSSDPADGAVLAVAPTQIAWVFANPVPLETMTVTLIDATGARTELSGSSHGPAGETEVVTPLPTLPAGPTSIRWRLVGPDGHPITGRIDVTISAAPPATTTPASAVVTAAPLTTAAPTITESTVDRSDTSYSTPGFFRWVLRYSSYLAIMAIVGILATSAYVWSGAVGNPRVRLVLGRSLFATAALGFLQLLVVASDVSGKAPWSSLGSIDPAMTTDAGRALVVRIVLAATVWLLLFRYRIVHPDVYWTALGVSALGLLATWAFAGHSRSMRWPTVGVATDVVHHAAAATWIAGLATVGWIVIPKMSPDVLVPAVRRFSRVAAISVAVLVATGLVQTVRLVGTPMDLFDANHGRYLAVKVVVLAGMLAVANANRRRIDHRLDDPQRAGRQTAALRQAVVAEFAIGLVIIAITALMVVAPPSSSESSRSSSETGAGAPPGTKSLRILHHVVDASERPPS